MPDIPYFCYSPLEGGNGGCLLLITKKIFEKESLYYTPLNPPSRGEYQLVIPSWGEYV